MLGNTKSESCQLSDGKDEMEFVAILLHVKSESRQLSDGKDEMEFVAIWLLVFLLAKTIFNVYLSSVCGVSTRLLLVALLQACYQLS